MTYQKAVTSTQYYDEIARRIQRYGSGDVLKPSEMAGAIDAIVHDAEKRGENIGYVDGHRDGYSKGLTEGEEQGRKAQYDEFWDGFYINPDSETIRFYGP